MRTARLPPTVTNELGPCGARVQPGIVHKGGQQGAQKKVQRSTKVSGPDDPGPLVERP